MRDWMKSPTAFLYLVLGGLTLAGLALAVLLIPGIAHPDNRDILPLVVVMYAAAVPYFLVLFQSFQLLRLIDKNQAFSEVSVRILTKISRLSAVIGALYVFSLPCLYILAQEEDAPGLVLIGLIAVGGPWTIAVFAGVLKMLLQNAIDYKQESDLTV